MLSPDYSCVYYFQENVTIAFGSFTLEDLTSGFVQMLWVYKYNEDLFQSDDTGYNQDKIFYLFIYILCGSLPLYVKVMYIIWNCL